MLKFNAVNQRRTKCSFLVQRFSTGVRQIQITVIPTAWVTPDVGDNDPARENIKSEAANCCLSKLKASFIDRCFLS